MKLDYLKVWVCGKCKNSKDRTNEKEMKCKCGNMMSKSARKIPGIAVAKRTIKEDEPSKKPVPISSQTLLDNFRAYNAQIKINATHETWWRKIFPKEEYPKKHNPILIALKIEYELANRVYEEEDKPLPEKFRKNYEASRTMILSKFSENLRLIVDSTEKALLKKKEREEEKKILKGKLIQPIESK